MSHICLILNAYLDALTEYPVVCPHVIDGWQNVRQLHYYAGDQNGVEVEYVQLYRPGDCKNVHHIQNGCGEEAYRLAFDLVAFFRENIGAHFIRKFVQCR